MTTTAYDQAGRVTSVANAGLGIQTFSYDDAGRLVTLELDSGSGAELVASVV